MNKVVFSTLLLLSLSFSFSAEAFDVKSKDQLEKETVQNLVKSLDTINRYATKEAGEVKGCNCDKDQQNAFDKLLKRIKDKLYDVQGSGISIGGDAHAGPGGINYSFEFLRFGNAFTLFDSKHGMKYAVYCVGGVGGGIDASATLGLSGVQTFGSCNHPKDYAGGFLNLGAQGEFAVGSLGARLSISFDMGSFSSLLEKDFSSSESRERLRTQFLEFLKYSATSKTSDESLLLGKLAGAMYFPKETSSLTVDDLKGFKTLQEKYKEDYFKRTQEKFSAFVKKHNKELCKNPKACLDGNASELTRFFNDVGVSLGRCHGISAGISVGPSAAPLVSPYLGYTDYVLMTSLDLNFSELAPELGSYLSKEVSDLWTSFTGPCSAKAENSTEKEERLRRLEKALSESANFQFNSKAFKKECEGIIQKSAHSTAKTLKYLLN